MKPIPEESLTKESWVLFFTPFKILNRYTHTHICMCMILWAKEHSKISTVGIFSYKPNTELGILMNKVIQHQHEFESSSIKNDLFIIQFTEEYSGNLLIHRIHPYSRTTFHFNSFHSIWVQTFESFAFSWIFYVYGGGTPKMMFVSPDPWPEIKPHYIQPINVPAPQLVNN